MRSSRIDERLGQIYKKIVIANMRVMLTFLCFIAVLGTSMLACDISERTFFVGDFVLLNILIVVLFVAIFMFLRKRIDLTEMNVKVHRGILLLVICALSIAWLLLTRYTPRSDQMAIYAGVQGLRAGDYSLFEAGGYFMKNPQQYGLVFIYYLWSLVFGSLDCLAYQLLNVVAIVLFYKKAGDICSHLGLNEKYLVFYGYMGIIFYPLIMYCSFIYGTLLGLAFALTALDHEIVFFKDGKKLHAVISLLFVVLAIFAKTNYIIFAIAMVIYAALETLKAKKVIFICYLIALIALLPISSSAPLQIAYRVTGQSECDSISAVAFVAMGLQEGPRANGWHNGYDNDSFVNNGYDSDVQRYEAIRSIGGRLRAFYRDPKYGAEFFLLKLASQWNNPTFECYWINQVCDTDIEQSSFIKYIVSKEGSTKAYGYLDVMLLLTLVGALAAFWLKDDFTQRQLIFATIFIGGFLFHIFWEAKGQYTLPYFVLLFPYAVMGYNALADGIMTIKTELMEHKKPVIDRKKGILLACTVLIVTLFIGINAPSLSRDNMTWQYYLETDEIIEG